MAKFKVVKGHDAWVKYATLVEADTQEEAEMTAMNPLYTGDWVEIGDIAEFDDFQLMEGETEELGDDSICELPEVITYSFSAIERDAILAGLRCLQDMRTMNAGELHAALHDILTNDGAHEGLSDEQIDRLCEELNQ